MGLPARIDAQCNLPPLIVVHGNRRSVGEAMQRGLEAGQGYFKHRPDILFVVLPEKGQAPSGSQNAFPPGTTIHYNLSCASFGKAKQADSASRGLTPQYAKLPE